MVINLAGLIEESIVDGPGFRMSVFTQGCPFHCPGCHNPETWSFEGGKKYTVDDLRKIWRANPLIEGITLSGGEPTAQKEAVLQIIKAANEDGLNAIMYSGHTLEELVALNDLTINEILEKIILLIDGRFILEQRTLNLPFRGSKNQRVIDMIETRKQQKIVLLEDYIN